MITVVKTLRKKSCLAKLLILGIIIYIVILLIIFIFVPVMTKDNSLQKYTEPENVDYDFTDLDFNHSLPSRIFKTNDYLIDQSFIDITQDACTNFYDYSCGNYNLGEQNEVIPIIYYENKIKKQWIDKGLVNGNGLICIIEGSGCINALSYYKNCVRDKIHHVQPINLINKLTKGMNNYTNIFQKIRFLIENGITNYVHLTKEKLENGKWVHYLRPGGVLFPDKTIHLNLYGDGGLMSSKKQLITIDEFLTITTKKWKSIFGRHSKKEDLLHVENLDYFDNLDNLLKNLNKNEIKKRLEWYIKQDFGYLYGKNCLEQTKLLFPITFCKLFQRLSLLDDKENGKDIAENVFNSMKSKYQIKTSLKVGTCSSLLHSNNLGEQLIQIENQNYINDFKSLSALEWAHKHLFKKWYKIYDPIYLFFTYPRILDNQLDDPLDWYAQVNAFYDFFHDEIIIPPGIIQYPLFHQNYNVIGDYSRFGYIIGHEVSHTFQNKFDLKCLKPTLGNLYNKKKYEVFADIIGLSESFKYFYLEGNIKDNDSCQFFLSFAQTFCSAHPKNNHGSHGSPFQRVMISINYGSISLINEFNRCFKCNKIEKCKSLKF